MRCNVLNMFNPKMTTFDVAVFLGVHINSVNSYRKRGLLSAERLPNGRFRFDPKEVKAFHAKLRKKPLLGRNQYNNKPELVQASDASAYPDQPKGKRML